MALTRKALKAMDLTEEQVESIIEAHTETLNGLKDELERLRTEVESVPDLRQELNEARMRSAAYNDLKNEFDKYKAGVEARETRTAKENAVKAYYEGKGITGANLDIAMRGSNAEIDAVELDGEKIKDAAEIDALVDGTFSSLVTAGRPSFDWSFPVGGSTQNTNDANKINQSMNALIRGAIK